MKPIHEIEDHREAAALLNEEFAALNITTTIHGGTHVTTDDSGWKHYAWQVEMTRNGKTVFFPWKTGTGLVNRTAWDKKLNLPGTPTKPNPAEVLGRVCADYLSAAHCPFEDWADDFGYDADSRKAESVYLECQSMGKHLKTLGLPSTTVQRLADLANLL